MVEGGREFLYKLNAVLQVVTKGDFLNKSAGFLGEYLHVLVGKGAKGGHYFSITGGGSEGSLPNAGMD